MRLSRCACALLGALLGLPLLARASRPVVPAGQPPPPPPPAPVDAGAEPTPPAPSTPAPAPARSAGPVRPAGSPAPTAPSSAPAPRELPPELTAKPVESKKIENPAEVLYRKKTETHYFRLRVRPGNPKPGDALELIIEVAELRDPPDPVLGDRVPVENEELVAVWGKSPVPHALHNLGAPGEFGLHLTADAAGVQSLTIRRRTDKPGLEATFPIGIGVPTPSRPDDVQASAEAKPVRPVTGAAPGAKDDLADLMRQLEEHRFALALALERPKADLGTHAQAIADLSAQVSGQVPAGHADRTREFDAVAKGSAALAAGLPHAADREKLKAKLGEVEQGGCLRCHAQFWYGVADDTSAWPVFTPAVGAHR